MFFPWRKRLNDKSILPNAAMKYHSILCFFFVIIFFFFSFLFFFLSDAGKYIDCTQKPDSHHSIESLLLRNRPSEKRHLVKRIRETSKGGGR